MNVIDDSSLGIDLNIAKSQIKERNLVIKDLCRQLIDQKDEHRIHLATLEAENTALRLSADSLRNELQRVVHSSATLDAPPSNPSNQGQSMPTYDELERRFAAVKEVSASQERMIGELLQQKSSASISKVSTGSLVSQFSYEELERRFAAVKEVSAQYERSNDELRKEVALLQAERSAVNLASEKLREELQAHAAASLATILNLQSQYTLNETNSTSYTTIQSTCNEELERKLAAQKAVNLNFELFIKEQEARHISSKAQFETEMQALREYNDRLREQCQADAGSSPAATIANLQAQSEIPAEAKKGVMTFEEFKRRLAAAMEVNNTLEVLVDEKTKEVIALQKERVALLNSNDGMREELQSHAAASLAMIAMLESQKTINPNTNTSTVSLASYEELDRRLSAVTAVNSQLEALIGEQRTEVKNQREQHVGHNAKLESTIAQLEADNVALKITTENLRDELQAHAYASHATIAKLQSDLQQSTSNDRAAGANASLRSSLEVFERRFAALKEVSEQHGKHNDELRIEVAALQAERSALTLATEKLREDLQAHASASFATIEKLQSQVRSANAKLAEQRDAAESQNDMSTTRNENKMLRLKVARLEQALAKEVARPSAATPNTNSATLMSANNNNNDNNNSYPHSGTYQAADQVPSISWKLAGGGPGDDSSRRNGSFVVQHDAPQQQQQQHQQLNNTNQSSRPSTPRSMSKDANTIAMDRISAVYRVSTPRRGSVEVVAAAPFAAATASNKIATASEQSSHQQLQAAAAGVSRTYSAPSSLLHLGQVNSTLGNTYISGDFVEVQTPLMGNDSNNYVGAASASYLATGSDIRRSASLPGMTSQQQQTSSLLQCKRFELFFMERYHFELYSESATRQQIARDEVRSWLDCVKAWCDLRVLASTRGSTATSSSSDGIGNKESYLLLLEKCADLINECLRYQRTLRELGHLWERREAELRAGWASASSETAANERAQSAVVEKRLLAQRRAMEALAVNDKRQLEEQVAELKGALNAIYQQQQPLHQRT